MSSNVFFSFLNPQILKHKTAKFYGELLLSVGKNVAFVMKSLINMKHDLQFPCGSEDQVFLTRDGENMSNSRCADIIGKEMTAIGVSFRATPNIFRHSAVTIVSK